MQICFFLVPKDAEEDVLIFSLIGVGCFLGLCCSFIGYYFFSSIKKCFGIEGDDEEEEDLESNRTLAGENKKKSAFSFTFRQSTMFSRPPRPSADIYSTVIPGKKNNIFPPAQRSGLSQKWMKFSEIDPSFQGWKLLSTIGGKTSFHIFSNFFGCTDKSIWTKDKIHKDQVKSLSERIRKQKN